MNLLNKASEFFGFGPKLRNKAGGYAFVNATVDEGCGSGAMVNRVVCTVKLDREDLWFIEPPQEYVVTGNVIFTVTGTEARKGDRVRIVSLRDNCLTPIPGDLCSDEEVSSLYQSNPTKEAA